MWPSSVDDEAVVAEPTGLGRPALELGQVDPPRGELLEDRDEAPRLVRSLVDDDGRLVVAGRMRDAVSGHDHEAGLVAVVIGDVGGDHLEAIELARERGADRRSARRPLLADHLGRLGGRVRGNQLDARQLRAQELMALRRRDGDRHDALHVVERGARRGEEAQLHVEHDLALDEKVVVEDEAVDRGVHRALDRVLDRDEAEVDIARFGRDEHLSDRRDGHEVALREVGLGEQRLLGEGAERPEETDALRRSRR